MPRKRNPVLRWSAATATIIFIRVIGAMPLSLARSMGRKLGHLAYYIIPRVQKIGMKNLNLAYGDTKTEKEKKDILMQSMENLGIMTAEFPHLPLLRTAKTTTLYETKNLEHLEGSNGGVVIGGHLSNWEWMAGIVSNIDHKSVGVVRPLDDPRLNRTVESLRSRSGMKTIGKKDVASELVKAVREGNIVGLLIDQSTRKNGVPVTFFGQPCWATTGPVMLAMRTRTPLYPVALTRSQAGFYTLESFPPIPIVRTGNIHQDLIDNSQKCQDFLEERVRENPGQWMWIHNRWKPQPNLEKEWQQKMKKS